MLPKGLSMDRANILSLTPPEAARTLTQAGGKKLPEVTAEMIEMDIEAGLPVNPDGTINAVIYVAWLIKGLANGRHSTVATE